MPKAHFLGVFSTRGMPAEPGGRAAGEQSRQYWFVWQDGLSKAYLAQQLNSTYHPEGKPRLLPGDTFRQSFTCEPRVRAVPTAQPDVADYLDKVFVRGARQTEESTLVSGRSPKRSEVSGPVGRGQTPDPEPEPGPRAGSERRAEGRASVGGAPPVSSESASSASSASAAASSPSTPEELDRSLRAEFAMNVMRLRRGDKNGAVRAFRRMVGVSDGIVAAHKHMFTDFGMDLRKSQLNDLALSSFQRALDLAPDDSHALFNVGRVLYELGKYREAGKYLDRALNLEPDLACALRLKEKIRAGVSAFVPQE